MHRRTYRCWSGPANSTGPAPDLCLVEYAGGQSAVQIRDDTVQHTFALPAIADPDKREMAGLSVFQKLVELLGKFCYELRCFRSRLPGKVLQRGIVFRQQEKRVTGDKLLRAALQARHQWRRPFRGFTAAGIFILQQAGCPLPDKPAVQCGSRAVTTLRKLPADAFLPFACDGEFVRAASERAGQTGVE